jgi:hypothetical protein
VNNSHNVRARQSHKNQSNYSTDSMASLLLGN